MRVCVIVKSVDVCSSENLCSRANLKRIVKKNSYKQWFMRNESSY